MKTLIENILQFDSKGAGTYSPSDLRRRLNLLPRQSVTPESLVHLAYLARVGGVPLSALRVLSGIEQHSPESNLEYCANLLLLGFTENVRRCLSALPSKDPQGALYLAISWLLEFEFERAANILNVCASRDDLSPYQSLLVRSLYAGALLNLGRGNEAEPILSDLLQSMEAKNYPFLQNDHLENHIRLELGKKNFPHAAIASLPSELKREKWEAILRLLRAEQIPRALETRGRLEKARQGDDVREMDLYRCLQTKDISLFRDVYFGTPWIRFREDLLQSTPWIRTSDLRHVFLRKWGDLSTTPLRVQELCREGTASHRLLCALGSDFYHSLGVGHLFERIFPGEEFSFESGRHRLHEIVRVTRKRLQSTPLRIIHDQACYSLRAIRSASLRLPAAIPHPAEEPRINELRANLPAGAEFNSKEFARLLGVSQRTASRILSKATEEEILKSRGKGKATRYRFEKNHP